MRHNMKLTRGSSNPWHVVDFPSCCSSAHQVEQEILDACRQSHYSDRDLFALKLALEEAMINAVKHGNHSDPAKHVHVAYRVTPQRADISVEDEGTGFNPAAIADPTNEENLESCHGRGLLLMRAFMSSVVFNPEGNRVTLTKFNESFRRDPARTVAFG